MRSLIKRTMLVTMMLVIGLVSRAYATTTFEPSQLPSTAVPLNLPILQGTEVVAEEYWTSRGIDLPPLEGVYELPAEERWLGIAGLAEMPGTRIWLPRKDLGFMHSSLRQVNVRSRVILCYIVLHERGHNAGLNHSDAETFPVMAPSDEVGAGWIRKEVAPRCWDWAKHPF